MNYNDKIQFLIDRKGAGEYFSFIYVTQNYSVNAYINCCAAAIVGKKQGMYLHAKKNDCLAPRQFFIDRIMWFM